MGSQMARHWIIGAVVMYGFGAIANAWVMRGAALRLGRVDDSSRLGYCRAVMLGTFVRSTPKPLLIAHVSSLRKSRRLVATVPKHSMRMSCVVFNSTFYARSRVFEKGGFRAAERSKTRPYTRYARNPVDKFNNLSHPFRTYEDRLFPG
jgi:hypothetical protein